MSTKFIHLTRFNIIGKITKETPRCVIYEVAESFGYQINKTDESEHYYNLVLETIQRRLPDNTASLEDNQRIATYVNANSEKWTVSNLRIAFQHLQKFLLDLIPEIPQGDFTYGSKTNENPLSYDACMLYRLCVYNNIKTSPATSIEQMDSAIKMLNDDTSEIRNNLLTTIRMMSKNQLINLSLTNESKSSSGISQKKINNGLSLPIPGVKSETVIGDIKRGRIDIDKIGKSHKRLTNTDYLMWRTDPKIHEEAIILSAIIYGINLTETINPYREYTEMKRLNKGDSYIPIGDSLFKIRYILNSTWYNTSRTWSPYLGTLYTPEQILSFAKSEGYKPSTFGKIGDQSLEFLGMTRTTKTFHLGIHPSMIKEESDIENLKTVVELEDVFEIGPAKIISFGIAELGDFELYTAESLTQHFKIHKKFSIPTLPGQVFSSSSIAKLKNICRDFTGQNESKTHSRPPSGLVMGAIEALSSIQPVRGVPSMANNIVTFANMFSNMYQQREKVEVKNVNEIITEYTNLLDSIEGIERLNIATGIHIERLRILHENVIYNPYINGYLTCVLHLGYYMRGWKVRKTMNNIDINVIPITRDETNTLNDVHGQVQINVSESIRALETYLRGCPLEIVEDLRNLPLMISAHDAFTDTIVYNPSSSMEDGFTILDRIGICKDGRSQYSCIRTSSNHFLSSVYYYMCGCGMDIPFHIQRMAKIS